MTEKTCDRCGSCCTVLPLFTQHMHPKYREFLLVRGLKEDKEQGCILIPSVCQHLTQQNTITSCDIHEDPNRPHICKVFHGQKIVKNARIYIPPGCAFAKEKEP